MDKEEVDKGDESIEEFTFSTVQQLSQATFETTLRDVEHALVMFYAPCKYIALLEVLLLFSRPRFLTWNQKLI